MALCVTVPQCLHLGGFEGLDPAVPGSKPSLEITVLLQRNLLSQKQHSIKHSCAVSQPITPNISYPINVPKEVEKSVKTFPINPDLYMRL